MIQRLLILALLLGTGCGKGASAGNHSRAPSNEAPPAAASASSKAAAVPNDDSSAKDAVAAGTVVLPDSEPAGAPFPASLAAAVAEVTQGAPGLTSRVYRAAYEQARREINQDNVYDRLRKLERQIDIERQNLP